ncbi:DUF4199 domain-containing protein [Aquimarina rhabdastrellae]
MENVKPSAKKFILNYGLILGIVSVLLGVILYVTDNHVQPHWAFSIIGLIIITVAIIMGIKAYKNENNSYLTIGEAIKIGLGIALISGIIGGVWSLLVSNVLDPDFLAKSIELQREQALQMNPNLTDEQLEQAAEIGKKFSSPFIVFAIGLVVNIFLGFIISLIGGAVMQKKENIY